MDFTGDQPLPSPKPFVVAFLNQKGGVGKTSSCHHVGGALARKKRVLLMDMDPQCSLTQGLLGIEQTLSLPSSETLAALFDDELEAHPESLIKPLPFGKLHLVPGSRAMHDFNLASPQKHVEYHPCVREFVEEVRADFDAIIIDCPPNLYLCSWVSLLASDFVVVPFQPEDYGSQNIVDVQQVIDLALAKFNPDLRLMGYLLTKVQRLTLHAAFDMQLRELYGDQVFKSRIPELKDFKETITLRQPVSFARPKSKAAKAVAAVAREILERAERVSKREPTFLYLENRVRQQESR